MNQSNSDGGNGIHFTRDVPPMVCMPVSPLHLLHLLSFFLSTSLSKGCSGKLGTCYPLRQSHDMASICGLSPLAKCLSAHAGSRFLRAGSVGPCAGSIGQAARDVCGRVAACSLEFLPRRSPANTMENMLPQPCHLATPKGHAGFSSGLFILAKCQLIF